MLKSCLKISKIHTLNINFTGKSSHLNSMSTIQKTSKPTPIWLDCDPGHDDAFAILLASYSPEINLLGISIVHGNDTVTNCALNAKRFMWASGIQNIPVYKGINIPIVRKAKHCPEIHGIPGEQGVAGLCGFHFPDKDIFANPSNQISEDHGVIKMYEMIKNHPQKVTLVATGAHTNLALAIRMFPDIKDRIEKIVFMGGAIGVGNTGVGAEFNIEIDPEAAHVVFHSGIPLVMVPLEVTHSVLVTPDLLNKISNIELLKLPLEVKGKGTDELTNPTHPHVEYKEIFNRIDEISCKNSTTGEVPTIPNPQSTSSPFAKCCTQLLTFFGSTYKSVFAFESPPLHDPTAVFYITNPECFKEIKIFVDVELASEKGYGRTLCDIHGIMRKEPNVNVCVGIDVDGFWNKMLNCIKIANANSPLNKL